jgi:ERF superfamily
MTVTVIPMQRSSESIAQLAAALAKAQGELVNPEKSLVATIKSEGAAEQTFRYAPLSSGLDIVRKTLGQQGIAVMQTTSTDPAAGVIMLTTMLAHASGEWIASDWPVCPIAETATPHRMGAALTYARRYALFTLVGIAGEDDMDAPNLVAPGGQTGPLDRGLANGDSGLNGSRNPTAHHVSRRRDTKVPTPGLSSLESDASAELCGRLIAEIGAFGSNDDATAWAQRRIADKDRLSATDARKVEEVFQQRLLSLSTDPAETSPRRNPSRRPARSRGPPGIDKSALTLPEPRRVRDRDHVRSVALKPCLICGRRPSDPHHLRFVQSRAMGRKVSDEFTVPLCRGHHREVHRSDEAAWWAKQGIDPGAAARALWLQSHPLPEIGPSIAARTHPADVGKLTEQRNEADRDPW